MQKRHARTITGNLIERLRWLDAAVAELALRTAAVIAQSQLLSETLDVCALCCMASHVICTAVIAGCCSCAQHVLTSCLPLVPELDPIPTALCLLCYELAIVVTMV